MIRRAALALAFALAALPVAGGETIVAGLSQSRVSITANFDGSEILIFGAVKRDAPEGAPLDVLITVEGPSTPLIIRRKERVAAIWVNRSAVRIDAAPSFYAVATTGPLDKVLSSTEDIRYKISLDRAIRAVGISQEASDSPDFVEALKRIRMADGAFRIDEGQISFAEQTLFRADVQLPANLTEGDYRVRFFLMRQGQVVDSQQQVIGVHKAGLEQFLFNLARQQSLIYGFASLALAVFAGWAASAAFSLLRR